MSNKVDPMYRTLKQAIIYEILIVYLQAFFWVGVVMYFAILITAISEGRLFFALSSTIIPVAGGVTCGFLGLRKINDDIQT